MANELNAVLDPSQTGLTVVARIRSNGSTQVGGDISCPETARLGWYAGDVPGGTAAGDYTVEFHETAPGTNFLAADALFWDGTAEITDLTSNLAREIIRKIARNKVVVAADELSGTVYEDDGVTPALTFTISADKRTRTPT